VRYALRIPKRIFKGKHSAPGVPQQYHRVEVKILPNLLQICDVGCERDVFRVHTIGRSATPALVVVDEMERIGEAVQLGQQIAVVEIGPAMQDDDRLASADFSGIQFHASDRDAAFMRRGVPFAFKRSRQIWRQPWCVCPRKNREDYRCFHRAKVTSTCYPAQSVTMASCSLR
jgi:hypothetical protein